jgi:hypothetical protein
MALARSQNDKEVTWRYVIECKFSGDSVEKSIETVTLSKRVQESSYRNIFR